MKKIIYIIIFLSFINSCTNEKTQVRKKEVIRYINLKTGLTGLTIHDINYCYDKNLAKEFVFFANRKSFIKSFDLDGNFIDSIPLDNYINITFVKPIAFSPYTKDTIVLYPDSHNTFMAVINSKGEILKRHYLDDLFEDSISNYFHFHYSYSPHTLEEIDKLHIVGITNISQIAEIINTKDTTPQLEQKFYFTQWMNYTYMLAIENFLNDTPTTNLFLSDYYKTNYIEGDITSWGKGYYYFSTKENLYLMNSCAAKITMFDTKNYKQIKEINVTSNFTKVGLTPTFCLSGNYLKEVPPVIEYSCYSYGPKIERLFFNEETKQYYIILSHELKNIEEWLNYNNGDYRPFSVIIYDENFENPKEYAFEAHTYICKNCFMSQEGLWLQRKPEKISRENYGTQTFDLLKFN